MNAFADVSHKCFRVTECLSDFLLMYLLRHEYPYFFFFFFFALNLRLTPWWLLEHKIRKPVFFVSVLELAEV